MAHTEYTHWKYLHMFIIMTELNMNSNLAVRRYRQLFPDKDRFPDYRVFQTLIRRLERTGSLVPLNYYPNRGRRYNVPHELEFLIIVAYQEEPTLSLRVAARRFHTNNSLVRRVLRRHRYQPYHHRRVQHLQGDRDNHFRFAYAQHLSQGILRNPYLQYLILYTDECTFTNRGMYNSNFVTYSNTGNPYVVVQDKPQNRWSMNIWCGVIGNKLVSIHLKLQLSYV